TVMKFEQHVRHGAHVSPGRRLLEDVRNLFGLPYHLIVGRLGQVLDKPLLRKLVQTNNWYLRQLQQPHGCLDGAAFAGPRRPYQQYPQGRVHVWTDGWVALDVMPAGCTKQGETAGEMVRVRRTLGVFSGYLHVALQPARRNRQG